MKKFFYITIFLFAFSAFAWSEDFSVQVKDGLVTVDVKDASLRLVVFAISGQADFEASFDKGVAERKVTAKFENLSVQDALKRLLKDESFTTDNKDARIVKLTVFPQDATQRKGLEQPLFPSAPANASKEALAAIAELKKIDPNVKALWDTNGTPCFVFGKLSGASNEKADVIALAFLKQNSKVFGITDASRELKILESQCEFKGDEKGERHAVYQQQYDGIGVYNRTVGVHIDKDGSVFATSGNFLSNPNATTDAKADLAKEKAAVILRGDVQDVKFQDPQTKEEKTSSTVTEATLEWYPEKGNDVHLTWHSDVTDLAKNQSYRVFVDADSGQVVSKEQLHAEDNNVQHPVQVVNYQNQLITVNAWTWYSPYFFTYSDNPNGTRFVYLASNAYLASQRTDANRNNGAYCYDSNSNNVLERSEAGVTGMIQYNMHRVLNYYYSFYYGRRSWDNNGSRIIAYSQPGLVNAMSFGNGYFTFGEPSFGNYQSGILADLGVVGHEFTHGVLSSYGVTTAGESGAVHEGSADIQGCACQYYYGQSNYWYLAPVRDLKQQVLYTQYLGNPEVHYGGQVLGHCAYLMTNSISPAALFYCHYHAIDRYYRGSVSLKNAYWFILYNIYRYYGYNYYNACYWSSNVNPQFAYETGGLPGY